jgi:hypothetical protein
MGDWIYTPPFMTSALGGGKWLASRPCRFTLGETATGIHGRSPEPSGRYEEKKILTPVGNRTPGFHPVVLPPEPAVTLFCMWEMTGSNLSRNIVVFLCPYWQTVTRDFFYYYY